MVTVVDGEVHGTAMVVRLQGAVTAASGPMLRELVLRRRPAGVVDVWLDAAGVTSIDDAVFSVLLAGGAWLRVNGGRMSFMAASPAVRRSLAALNLTLLLPVSQRALPAVLVPAPRSPVDLLAVTLIEPPLPLP